jgi:hypothetical protein
MLAITLLAMTTFTLPSMLTYDFRGDIDRMDVLKSLPIAPSRLVLGQLIAPVLLGSLAQLFLLLLLQFVLGGVGLILLLTLLFALPVNALLFALENLLFLWFPTRQMATTGADFEQVGRTFLLLLSKIFLLGCGLAVASVPTVLTYFLVELLGGPAKTAAGAVAWLMLAALTGLLLPVLALAFENFDVARDTPP